jgi:hypothetical protein
MELRRAVSIVVVGLAVVALGWAARSHGQTRQEEPIGAQEAPPRDHHVAPADHCLLQGSAQNVDARWEQALVEVPAGKWLTLTDISIGRTAAAQLFSVEGKSRRVLLDTSNYPNHVGPWADPQCEFTSYHSTIGLVLPPESKLLIRHGGAGKASEIAWHITGFYEDA